MDWYAGGMVLVEHRAMRGSGLVGFYVGRADTSKIWARYANVLISARDRLERPEFVQQTA